MRKFIYIAFISICLIGCSKCKKKQPEPEKVYSFPIQPDLYSYAYFKAGTYWVYQDSVTNVLDSVYVTSSDSGTYTNAPGTPNLYAGTFNYFSCSMLSSYDHYRYQNWMDQSYEVNGSKPVVNRSRYATTNSGSNTGSDILIGLINIGTSFGNNIKYDYFYNTFNVKILVFPNTQKWINPTNYYDDNQKTNYFIAKNIGIVRREQLDSGKTWNLIRYHIVQ